MTTPRPALLPRRPSRRQHQRGVAAIEAALILPLLVFMLAAALEVYAYLRTAAVISRTGYTIADLLAEAPALQDTGACHLAESLCTAWPLAQGLAQPTQFAQRGAVRLALYGANPEPDGVAAVRGDASAWELPALWQLDASGPEALPPTPIDPADGPPATVGDVLIVVQTSYHYQPLLLTPAAWNAIVGSPRIDRVAYALGRGSLLTEAP